MYLLFSSFVRYRYLSLYFYPFHYRVHYISDVFFFLCVCVCVCRAELRGVQYRKLADMLSIVVDSSPNLM